MSLDILLQHHTDILGAWILQGSNFDRGATRDDCRILLESTECNEVDLLTNVVSCKPPKKATRVNMTGSYEKDMIRVKVIR